MSLNALFVALALAQPGPTPLPELLDGAVPDYDGSVSADASVFDADAAVMLPDASTSRPDASVPPVAGAPWPRPASLSLGGGVFVAAWESPLRDEAFGSERGRGADLWSNGWRGDGGPVEAWGNIICPAAQGERLSEPRVAWTGTDFAYAWRVEKVGASGHSLRTARVTPAGATSGCGDFVENSGAELTSLGLAAVGATVLAVWETASEVRGKLFGAPGSFVVLQKSATDAFVRPSVTALDSGFSVVWLDGVTMRSRAITTSGSLGPPQDLTVLGARHAVVTGAVSATVVYVEADISANSAGLWAVDPGSFGMPTPLRAYTTDAPPLAATAGSFLYAAHRPYAGAPAAEVVQRAVTAPANIPNGGAPEAMASGEQRAGLLVSEAGSWRVYSLPALANGNGPLLADLGATRLGPWQQVPSVAWVEPAGWVLTWFEARSRSASGALVTLDGGFRGLATLADAGVPRMVSATAEGRAGATLFTGSATQVHELASAALPTTASTVRLEVPGEQPAAALGAHVTAAWNPAAGVFWWNGANAPLKWEYPAGVLGRCGAFAASRLWVPTLGERGSGVLGLLSLEDASMNASAQPSSHALLTGVGAGSGTPCLAANGEQGLVAWIDGAQKLALARVDLSSPSPTAVLLPLPGGSVKGRDPVVAAIAGGWAVAWELEDAVRSQVQSLTVGLDGASTPPVTWSNANDARSPALASCPSGDALLAFHQFSAEFGAVQVKHKLLAGLPALDGGVADGGLADGGTSPADGGTSPADGGTSPADGGVSPVGGGAGGGGGTPGEPVTFASCGCATDGASLLVLLALASARRRRR